MHLHIHNVLGLCCFVVVAFCVAADSLCYYFDIQLSLLYFGAITFAKCDRMMCRIYFPDRRYFTASHTHLI